MLTSPGFTRLYASTKTYVRWLSKKYANDQKLKEPPIAQLGTAMINHSGDFEDDVEFGQCLLALGEVQEKLGRVQEGYLANVVSCWQESLEHSLSQMADYHEARKQLQSKRLAYDAAKNQLNKSKKDDARLEDTVIASKRQFAGAYRETVRLMRDIRDAEDDTIVDLTSFVGAQIAYHEACRDTLLSLRKHWPASLQRVEQSASQLEGNQIYRSARSLASTTNLYQQQTELTSETSSDSSSSRSSRR